MSKLDEATVKSLIGQLEEHFGEPVRPVSEYCGAMRAWFGAVHQGADRERVEEDGKEFPRRSLRALSEAIHAVDLAISKSACLDRLIYGKERIRTKMCPIHKGRWVACAWDLQECANEEYPFGCMSGSNITGWLPEPEDLAAQKAWIAEHGMPHGLHSLPISSETAIGSDGVTHGGQ